MLPWFMPPHAGGDPYRISLSNFDCRPWVARRRQNDTQPVRLFPCRHFVHIRLSMIDLPRIQE